jgi:hypothetical protein
MNPPWGYDIIEPGNPGRTLPENYDFPVRIREKQKIPLRQVLLVTLRHMAE